MSFETELQKAIFARLEAELDVPVYDDVPQPADGGDAAMFPYVTIGNDTHIAWDTDTEVGSESTITIHSWSRYKGRSELKALQGEVYDALHRYNLPVTGFNTVNVEFEFSESVLDPDGLTRHGVQRFRITLEQT